MAPVSRRSRVYSNQEYTQHRGSSIDFQPGCRGSASSSYSDYRYDSVGLPPAGVTTRRAHDASHAKKKSQSGPPSELKCLGVKDGKTPPDTDTARARSDPSRFHSPAGQLSGRVATSIHQNLHDLHNDANKAHTNPRDAVNERVKYRAQQGHRLDDSTFVASDQRVGTAENFKRKKGDGMFGTINEETDPITHFKHNKALFEKFVKDLEQKWKSSKRLAYEHKASDQTWTWQSHLDWRAAEREKENARENKSKARDVGQIISVRGEQVYNMCGAEDLLPAGIYEYIKCDVPPTTRIIRQNDRQYMPVCVRSEVLAPNDYQNSDGIWNMFQFGAWSEDAQNIRKAEEEEEARRREEQRPHTARAVLQSPNIGDDDSEEAMFLVRKKKNTGARLARPRAPPAQVELKCQDKVEESIGNCHSEDASAATDALCIPSAGSSSPARCNTVKEGLRQAKRPSTPSSSPSGLSRRAFSESSLRRDGKASPAVGTSRGGKRSPATSTSSQASSPHCRASPVASRVPRRSSSASSLQSHSRPSSTSVRSFAESLSSLANARWS